MAYSKGLKGKLPGKLVIGVQGPPGPQGPKGDPFTYEDFTEEQLKGLTGPQGPKGDPFTYEDFSEEQLAGLIGPQGPQGEQGIQGEKGVKGDKGDKGDTGAQGIQGEPGEKGADGYTPVKGTDYYTEEDKAELLAELRDETPEESDTVEVVHLEEQDVSGFILDANFGYFVPLYPAPFELGIGDTYRVMWDGTEYEVVAQDASVLSPGAIFAGNGTMIGLAGGNNEPFIIGYADGAIVFSAFSDSAASHKIGVYQTLPVPVLPPVSNADNDKIMQVVNGAWGKVRVADSAVATYVNSLFDSISQTEYDALVAAGTVDESKYYMIVGDGE